MIQQVIKRLMGAVAAVALLTFFGGGACTTAAPHFSDGVAGSAGTTAGTGASPNAGKGSGGSANGAAGDPASGGTETEAGGQPAGEAGDGSTDPALKLPAEACKADAECTSKHCADGVCCDTACDGACYACNGKASPGHCTAVASGEQSATGHPACEKTSASTCGDDGTCDGKGACRKFESGTDCGGGSCDTANNSAVTGKACDGQGTCVGAKPVTCAPFKCAATGCSASCNGDADCVGQPCVNKSCGKVADGNLCKTDAQCSSGNCVDGYCCNVKCGSSCQACDLSGHEGVCTTLPPGGKPRGVRAACATGSCTSSCDGASPTCSFQAGAACGTCHACTAAGACQPVGDGAADPACPASAASCRVAGCDAFGACKAAPSGTQCGGYSCAQSIVGIGQYTGVDRHKSTCDGGSGSASCKPAVNEGCAGNLTCADATTCKNSCAHDIDCLNGYFCKAGVCTAWIATDSATACSGNSQCASRLCSAGKCVECVENLDCPPTKWSCTNNHCGCPGGAASCAGCDSTQFTPLCPSGRGQGCIKNNLCDCWGTPGCAVGTVCVSNSSAGPGMCLIGANMPCHADSDCVNGKAGTCANGTCTYNFSNCGHRNDCPNSGDFCCGNYGSLYPNCSSDCG
jgi:hypothetical protein